MLIKAQAVEVLKEIILKSKYFCGRVLFGKQVIFITTSGGANIETIKRYIERQREK